MTVLSKKEAAALLGISPRTLERRLAAGRYSCTRTGDGPYAALNFTCADLGLPEPALAPVVVVAPEPTPTPLAPKVEPEPEPYREPVCIHRYADGSLVAMAHADSADQLRRDRNAAIVKRRRDHLMCNLKAHVLSGTPEPVARQQIDEECNLLLKQLNRTNS
jgi:hypothetical protein